VSLVFSQSRAALVLTSQDQLVASRPIAEDGHRLRVLDRDHGWRKAPYSWKESPKALRGTGARLGPASFVIPVIQTLPPDRSRAGQKMEDLNSLRWSTLMSVRPTFFGRWVFGTSVLWTALARPHSATVDERDVVGWPTACVRKTALLQLPRRRSMFGRKRVECTQVGRQDGWLSTSTSAVSGTTADSRNSLSSRADRRRFPPPAQV
jgi:hypothetical protein